MSNRGSRTPPPWFPAIVRIAFGLMWAVDAAFKWAPSFRDHLRSYLVTDGQPGWVVHYVSWWSSLIGHSPQTFAVLLALGETVVAASLLLGYKVRAVCIGGAALSLLIWSTAEGFGGPYGPGSTDVGTSIAYVAVFALLWWVDAGRVFGLDGHVERRAAFSGLRRAPILLAAATAVVTGLLVTAAALVTSGPGSTSDMSRPADGGQMMMPSGGQDSH
jgi:thiosulfate dehydrogenase (quinone) large subunit